MAPAERIPDHSEISVTPLGEVTDEQALGETAGSSSEPKDSLHDPLLDDLPPGFHLWDAASKLHWFEERRWYSPRPPDRIYIDRFGDVQFDHLPPDL